MFFARWLMLLSASFAVSVAAIQGHAETPAHAHSRNIARCDELLDLDKVPEELKQYELIRDMSLAPSKDIKTFQPSQGIFVTKRDDHGNPMEGFIRVLSDNPQNRIEVIGDFNNWGRGEAVVLHHDIDPKYMTGKLKNISHGMRYRLVVNGQQLIDPAALVQTAPEFNEKIYGVSELYLNSVFWDIEGKGKYTPQSKPVDLRATAVSISENEIMALVRNWRWGDQVGPARAVETYNFVADSGLIQKLKSWGVNAVEFLPLTTSVDGDVWAYRYLTYAPSAIDSRWGTPTEFARMIDAFNAAGIAVIMDIVPGHFPASGNKGARDLSLIGIHNFKKDDGQMLYGNGWSEWGTLRFDYQNPYVRKYLVDGVMNFIKHYGISGIRIDNYGGIQALPGGRQFIKELNETIRAYAPAIWENAESFGGDNNITKRQDWGGDGATAHNDGDFFGFVYEYVQKQTEEIDMNLLRGIIRNSYGWHESATMKYATNHDESANPRGKASGSYLPTLVGGGGWYYVEGKVRTFASLAMLSGSFYLDMPHLRILQEGSFYQNPAVEWDNLKFDSQRHMSEFFADLSKYYIGERAFAFHNTHPDFENHIDHINKIISIKRVDSQTGKEIYIVINLGDRSFPHGYRFGVSRGGLYKLAIDSDSAKYGGSNRLSAAAINADDSGATGKSHSINLPYLAPYSVTVLERPL